MKTLLITLTLALAFTTSAQAGKAGITMVTPDPTNRIELVDIFIHDEGCTYTVVERLSVYFNGRRNNTLSLQVMSGDQILMTLYSWLLPENRNYSAHYHSGSFTVPSGQAWSLFWVLEKPKGKNPIVDAVEMFASACPGL